MATHFLRLSAQFSMGTYKLIPWLTKPTCINCGCNSFRLGWSRLFERQSNLDTPVATMRKLDDIGLRSHTRLPSCMYACLDVDVAVGGFEKCHFNFVPGVTRTSAIGCGFASSATMSAGNLSAQARVSCDNSARNCASVIACPSVAIEACDYSRW
jgi:hypothetical protein